MWNAVHDPLLRAGLVAFFEQERQRHMESLVSAVRQHLRDTMKEARLAGKEEAYREILGELDRFAKEQLGSASQ